MITNSDERRMDAETRVKFKARVAELWVAGMPTAEAAKVMSGEIGMPITKNQIIRATRSLNLPRRPTPIRKRTEPKPVKAKVKVRRHFHNMGLPANIDPPPGHLPKDSSPAPNPIPVEQLRHHTCRWPEWTHEGKITHMYCGEYTVPTRPYCLRHCQLAYARPKGAA